MKNIYKTCVIFPLVFSSISLASSKAIEISYSCSLEGFAESGEDYVFSKTSGKIIAEDGKKSEEQVKVGSDDFYIMIGGFLNSKRPAKKEGSTNIRVFVASDSIKSSEQHSSEADQGSALRIAGVAATFPSSARGSNVLASFPIKAVIDGIEVEEILFNCDFKSKKI